MVALGVLGCAAAMLLVRIGWGGVRGAGPAGWVLGAASLAGLASLAGAWGVAAGTVAGMAAAVAIVLHAGWTAPARTRRPARAPAPVAPPRVPGDIRRRVVVFLLVVPVGFVAAQWCAFGLQAFARGAGSGAADASVLALFAQPMLWGALMAWQVTRPSAAAMALPPVTAVLGGTLLWAVA